MNKTPTMRLARARATSTTYELIVDQPLGGYALCTVNDQTGELLITSDWGNWAYQWSPRPEHLGATSLTAFFGGERDVSVDYVARKLQGASRGEQFSAEASTSEIIGRIAERRLEDGRTAIEYARDMECSLAQAESRLGDDPGRILRRKYQVEPNHRTFWTKDASRSLADAIQNVADDVGDSCDSAEALFLDRVCAIIGQHDAGSLIEEPWEYIRKRQTYPDRVLCESILPALFAACTSRYHAQMMVRANGPQEAAL